MGILVVDDERAVRDSLRRALELEGYDVELAEDGEQALRRLEVDPQPDAVILDVLMPGADGLEVCRRLRSIGNEVPVLMLTAKDGEWDQVEALESGADDYVTKPFSSAILVARLRALIRRGAVERPTVLEAGDLRLDPAARVDSCLITLLPGDSHTFEVTSAHPLDEVALTTKPVLRCVNDLIAG